MFKNLKSRFEKGYIRPDQLLQYVALQAITAEQTAEVCGEEYGL